MFNKLPAQSTPVNRPGLISERSCAKEHLRTGLPDSYNHLRRGVGDTRLVVFGQVPGRLRALSPNYSNTPEPIRGRISHNTCRRKFRDEAIQEIAMKNLIGAGVGALIGNG